MNESVSLVEVMAQRFGMMPEEFKRTIKASCFPKDLSVTDEMFLTFLAVAREHDLNPLLREIYAYPRGAGIQVIVGVDGWMKLINRHPQFDGMTFEDIKDTTSNLVAITCCMFRRDRKHPIEATEYMAECRDMSKDTWKRWPKRMLRHKAAIQAARYAFSFAGIADPDEGERIIEATTTVMPKSLETSLDQIAEDLPETKHLEVVMETEAQPPAPSEPEPEPDRPLTDAEIEEIQQMVGEKGVFISKKTFKQHTKHSIQEYIDEKMAEAAKK